MKSLKCVFQILPLAAIIAVAGTFAVEAKNRGGGDPTIDGHSKIEVHARYPGDDINRGKYGLTQYHERCNWFLKGSFWGGDRPLGLTQACARIEVPADRDDAHRN
jgi:hypothetical protein